MAASSITSNGLLLHQDTTNTIHEQQQKQQQQQQQQMGQPEQQQQHTLINGKKNYPLKEFGINGAVFIAFENYFEIWDWSPSVVDDTVTEVSDNTLYLVSRSNDFEGCIEFVTPLECDRNENKYSVLVSHKIGNDHFFKVVKLHQKLNETKWNIVLPPSIIGSAPYHCKVLKDYFIIVTSEGCTSIFDKTDFKPIMDLEIFCKVINGAPVWDAQGNWLIYNPSIHDPYYQRIVLGSSDYNVAPLNLPKPGPLLNRLLKNLSSTAIDGVFKIAEISHSKLKKYMSNSNDDDATKSRNLRDTITKILNALNETSTKQFLILFSMETRQPLFVFSPPGGCSKVSLSPYDLLLSTATLRGDDIFIWDYTKFGKEISLIEKFKRGKTPGIIDQIIWYPRNRYIGVLSRLSGSLHWFQNNFLNEYEETNSWTMSSFGLKKMMFTDKGILAFDNKNNLKIVDCNGTCDSLYELPRTPTPKELLADYLIKNDTKIIEPGSKDSKVTTSSTPSKSGVGAVKNDTRFVEPNVRDRKVNPSSTSSKAGVINNDTIEPSVKDPEATLPFTPSKLELDYTSPYEFFYKNRKAEFYHKNSVDLKEWFFQTDDDKDLTKIDFGRANGVAVFHDNKESINTLLNE